MSASKNKLKRFGQELLRRRVVRVAIIYGAGAWIFIQVADIFLEAFEQDALLKYVIAFLVAGLPLALVLSWMFDITPRGIERTSPSTQAAGELPSIAVLPFANVSEDPANEYFSDGLAEEIRDRLARVPGLRVAARTSSFAFKGKHQDAREIGRRLNVRLLLEGGVRKHRHTVRISAQLVDARGGYQVWSETFERKLEDVFEIQSEISRAILEAVHVKLIEHHATRQPTHDFEAYNLYLLGRHHFHRRTETSLNRAVEYFRKAIALDDSFALAYSGIADATCLLSTGFYGNLSAAEAVARALPAAERALEIDPESVEAQASMGLIRHTQRNRDDAIRTLERAIAINPDYALAHVWLGMTLIAQGRYREAAMRNAEALRIDPLSPIANANAGFDALRFGDDRQAEERFSSAIELDPGFAVPYSGMGRLRARRGRLDEALSWVNQAIELAPARAFYLARKSFLYLQLGQIARAEQWLDATVRQSADKRFISDAMLAVAIAADSQDYLRDAADGSGEFDLAQRGLAAWLVDRPDQALELYDRHCPRHDSLILNMINDDWVWRFEHSLNCAHLRLVRGHQHGADEINDLLAQLEEARKSGLAYAETHYWSAAALAVVGRRDESLTHLESAIDKGWRNLWWARRDPNLTSLHDDPGFTGLLERVEGIIARSAARL